jgi:hypothetical protein
VDERALADAGGADDREERLELEPVDDDLGLLLAAEEPRGVAGAVCILWRWRGR